MKNKNKHLYSLTKLVYAACVARQTPSVALTCSCEEEIIACGYRSTKINYFMKVDVNFLLQDETSQHLKCNINSL